MILAVPVSVCSPCHLANYFDTWGEPSEDRGIEDDSSYTGVWMQSGVVKCQIIPYFMIFLCSEWLPRPGARAPPRIFVRLNKRTESECASNFPHLTCFKLCTRRPSTSNGPWILVFPTSARKEEKARQALAPARGPANIKEMDNKRRETDVHDREQEVRLKEAEVQKREEEIARSETCRGTPKGRWEQERG